MHVAARVLTAIVDVGGDVHGGVVVVRQALEQRILLEVGPYPIFPPLGLVGVQLDFERKGRKTKTKKQQP